MRELILLLVFIYAIKSIFTCEILHQISNDDTCDSLTTKYSLELNELLKINFNLSCETLTQNRTKICVKKLNFMRPLIPSCTRNYTVVSGDTCAEISTRHGIEMKRFLNLNPNIDCYFIGKYYNQQLCLNSTCLEYYMLNEGDTCELISEKNNITVDKLHELNVNVDCINMDFTRLCIKIYD